MNANQFLNKENVETLWDVITDEDTFKFLSKDHQSIVLKVFETNINGFFKTEKQTERVTLIELNKKYILLILNYIRQHFPEKMPSKIRIHDEPQVKELITYEEIQNDKKSQFEKNLIARQNEFTSAMTLPVPEVPNFADKYKDTPISDIDKIIKEMTAKRNYDVEQLVLTSSSTSSSSDLSNENWLKPQETSIKNEKFTKPLNTLAPLKNVTWGFNEEYTDDTSYEEDNIFKKLKKNSSTVTMKEKTVEERLTHIEDTIQTFNTKIDRILYFMEKIETK